MVYFRLKKDLFLLKGWDPNFLLEFNINKNCLNYILEFRNTKSYYLGKWAKIETVIENHVCSIVGHCYYSFQALS